MQDAQPPPGVIRFGEPVMKALLRSPPHRLLDGNLMLLTLMGRKTGLTYTVPVGRHELSDGSFVLSAAGNWRHNLGGGTDGRTTLDGRNRAGHAVLEEDSDRVAEAFKTMLDRSGPRALGVRVTVHRSPTAAEIKPVIEARGVAYLQLTD